MKYIAMGLFALMAIGIVGCGTAPTAYIEGPDKAPAGKFITLEGTVEGATPLVSEAEFSFFNDKDGDRYKSFGEQVYRRSVMVGADGRARVEAPITLSEDDVGKVLSFGLRVFLSIPGGDGFNYTPAVFHLVEVIEE